MYYKVLSPYTKKGCAKCKIMKPFFYHFFKWIKNVIIYEPSENFITISFVLTTYRTLTYTLAQCAKSEKKCSVLWNMCVRVVALLIQGKSNVFEFIKITHFSEFQLTLQCKHSHWREKKIHYNFQTIYGITPWRATFNDNILSGLTT